ncbi:MAG: hypothetical protein JWN64_374 [Parcubacteria group bacterium]|nr:hypothetical protein [Parcubacteria group bacterium]
MARAGLFLQRHRHFVPGVAVVPLIGTDGAEVVLRNELHQLVPVGLAELFIVPADENKFSVVRVGDRAVLAGEDVVDVEPGQLLSLGACSSGEQYYCQYQRTNFHERSPQFQGLMSLLFIPLK